MVIISLTSSSPRYLARLAGSCSPEPPQVGDTGPHQGGPGRARGGVGAAANRGRRLGGRRGPSIFPGILSMARDRRLGGTGPAARLGGLPKRAPAKRAPPRPSPRRSSRAGRWSTQSRPRVGAVQVLQPSTTAGMGQRDPFNDGRCASSCPALTQPPMRELNEDVPAGWEQTASAGALTTPLRGEEARAGAGWEAVLLASRWPGACASRCSFDGPRREAAPVYPP